MAVAVLFAVSLPPARQAREGRGPGRSPAPCTCIQSVRTARSPTRSSRRRPRRLEFIVSTDHGDATPTDLPRYLARYCLDGVEISTTGGHYVSWHAASPYPPGGSRAPSSRTFTAGGFWRRAHPTHRSRVSWREWTARSRHLIVNPTRALALAPREPTGSRRSAREGALASSFQAGAAIVSLMMNTERLARWDARPRRAWSDLPGSSPCQSALKGSDGQIGTYRLPTTSRLSRFRSLQPERPSGDAAADARA